MKKLLSVGMVFCAVMAGSSAAELNKIVMREISGKCVAAFQRDPSAADLIGSPMAYCTCVGEYVAVSKDDRKAAADRAGLHCMQAIKSPDSFGRGMARATFDSCVADPEVKKYFPASYSRFCNCLGDQFSAAVMDKAALKGTASNDFGKLVDAKMEAATARCVGEQ